MADDVHVVKVLIPADVQTMRVAVDADIQTVKVRLPGIQGPQGQQGEPGPSGGSVITALATVDCGGHKVVRAVSGGVAPASSSDPLQAGSVLGVTIGAALAGDLIEFQAAGAIEEPSWSFSVGPVFLGPAGALTQIRPTTGFLQQIGVATAPTRVLVQLGLPMILA